jgi:Ca2+-binding RTX toxin-like protein
MAVHLGSLRVARAAVPLVVGMFMGGAPASATTAPCAQTGAKVDVTIDEPVHSAMLFVDTGEELKLRVDSGISIITHDCGAATTANTNNVNVDGSVGQDIFEINQSGPGGSFPHTKFWDVTLGAGSDTVRVLGRPVVDRIYVNKLVSGGNTFDVIDTNGDGNPNIDLFNVQRVEIRSFGGNDQIGVSGSGYQTLGTFQLFPARLPLILKAGSGNDDLTGGIKNDVEAAGAGNDDLKGGQGSDLLKGQGGSDHMNGGPGSDTCLGGPGNDTAVQCE